MTLVEITKKAGNLETSVNNVLNEEIQKSVLSTISSNKVLRDATLQGGNGIRFFYDGPRYSEDLDFASGKMEHSKISEEMSNISDTIAMKVKAHLPFLDNIQVTPKENKDNGNIILSFMVSGWMGRQKSKVKIEFASVPAYTSNTKLLETGMGTHPVQVEDLNEILHDKIVAVVLRPYLKGRDIWDIYYITKHKNPEKDIDADMIADKIGDYGKELKDFKELLPLRKEEILSDGGKPLKDEMARFLPLDLYVFAQDNQGEILNAVKETLDKTETALNLTLKVKNGRHR